MVMIMTMMIFSEFFRRVWSKIKIQFTERNCFNLTQPRHCLKVFVISDHQVESLVKVCENLGKKCHIL